MIRLFTLLFLVISLFVATSCSSMEMIDCPYVVADSRIELGALEDSYEFAGVHFSLYNDSLKDISSFTVSFLVYDNDGQNPFIGSNCIVKSFNAPVAAHTKSDFSVSLDSNLVRVPKEKYILDFFYIKKISYADGSVWTDPFGMHSTSEVSQNDD